jgi:glycerol kinase
MTAAGPLVLAIDQGTSSSKALLVDQAGVIVSSAAAPLGLSFPRPGWVEQDADEIVASVRSAVAACTAGVDPTRIAAVGLSNQRESLVLWERRTGRPLAPVISWQDQRTVEVCADLVAGGHADLVRDRSGLPLDPMFSATKAGWLLDAVDPDRSRSRSGELCLGTVDSYLIARLTGSTEPLVEVGNASRTQLMNIDVRGWDADLLDLFRVPIQVLGRITPSVGPFPAIRGLSPVPDGTPLAAVLGDSHAALFAHAGWQPGTVKATYGTGSSVMGLCPPDVLPDTGLCLTVAWDDGVPAYAAEGNIRSSGATLGWLARLAGSTPAALAELAADADSAGVHLVPAFSGLGAPWWDGAATGLLAGLTFGAELPQLARAALESVAFQVEDVVAAVSGSVHPVGTLLADGGASHNDVLMQLQADLSGRSVQASADPDLSPLGAAHLAATAVGLLGRHDLSALPRARRTFEPGTTAEQRARRQAGWHEAVARSRWRPSATPC